jgi:tetratricopeptide (TPR) repeat protein
MAYRAVHVSDLEDVSVAGVHLRPVRRPLGITAFGTNAYSADAGQHLIEEHDEAGGGAGRHEELYVVLTGHARFTVDGEDVDAPAGTLVFCPEPGTLRAAVALEDGTTALVVGGPAGAGGPVSAWEWYMAAAPYTERGDWEGAYDFAAQGLPDHPAHPSLEYNLACFAAMAGHRERALEHLRKAVELKPDVLEWAADDSDLDPVRDDPAFPRGG